MKGLRPLLRLDDKVAAEGRRLQNLGARTSHWGGLTLLVTAAILHGAMLMLPTLHVKATLPAASPAPDFPRVWRFETPPAAPAARPAVAEAARPPSAAPPRDSGVGPEITLRIGSSPARRPGMAEPVPEPAPDATLRMITSEVAENVPYPDAPPPTLEPGPSFGAAPPPEPGGPRLVGHVQPAYPAAARSVAAEGQVRLRLTVLPDGRVDRASVVDCSRPGVGFEAAAVDAVKRWRYEPDRSSQAVRSTIVTVEFKKQEDHP